VGSSRVGRREADGRRRRVERQTRRSTAAGETFDKIVAGEQNPTTGLHDGQAEDQGRSRRPPIEAPKTLLVRRASGPSTAAHRRRDRLLSTCTAAHRRGVRRGRAAVSIFIASSTTRRLGGPRPRRRAATRHLDHRPPASARRPMLDSAPGPWLVRRRPSTSGGGLQRRAAGRLTREAVAPRKPASGSRAGVGGGEWGVLDEETRSSPLNRREAQGARTEANAGNGRFSSVSRPENLGRRERGGRAGRVVPSVTRVAARESALAIIRVRTRSRSRPPSATPRRRRATEGGQPKARSMGRRPGARKARGLSAVEPHPRRA